MVINLVWSTKHLKINLILHYNIIYTNKRYKDIEEMNIIVIVTVIDKTFDYFLAPLSFPEP